MKILSNKTERWTKHTGKCNSYKILVVYAIAKGVKISDDFILKNLSLLSSPEGRFELVNDVSDKIGIIDYAHSPDSLKNVITTINEIQTSDKILLNEVGCGDNIDNTKTLSTKNSIR